MVKISNIKIEICQELVKRLKLNEYEYKLLLSITNDLQAFLYRSDSADTYDILSISQKIKTTAQDLNRLLDLLGHFMNEIEKINK